MPEVLASNLLEKAVIGSDGSELGTLSSITMDTHTGELADLLVDPGPEVREGSNYDLDENGQLPISVSRLQAVKDHVVVGR